MDFVAVAKQSLVDNYGPECSGCGTPILASDLMFQDSKSTRVMALVFKSECVPCKKSGEVTLDIELQKRPKIIGSLRLSYTTGMPPTDEIIAEAEEIIFGSR